MPLQQYRSTLRAQPRRRMVREGDDGGDGEPSVAMVTGASSGLAYGSRRGRTSDTFGGIQEGVTSLRFRASVDRCSGEVEDGEYCGAGSSCFREYRACHTVTDGARRGIRNIAQDDANKVALRKKAGQLQADVRHIPGASSSALPGLTRDGLEAVAENKLLDVNRET